MNPGTTVSLTRQLDLLEARGRGHLRDATDRLAAVSAMAIGIPVALATTLCLLVVQLIHPLAPLGLLGAAVAIPVVVALALFLWERRVRQTRGDALAVVDRRLALKDRATTSDEFMRAPARTGFEVAALLEAESWLDDAAGTALPRASGVTRPSTGQWLMLAGAGVVLMAAMVLTFASGGSQRGASAGVGGPATGDATTDRRAAHEGDDAAAASGARGDTGGRQGGPTAGGSVPSPSLQDRSHPSTAPTVAEPQASQQNGTTSSRSSAAGPASPGPAGAGRRDAQAQSQTAAGGRNADPATASQGSASARDAATAAAAGDQRGERGRGPTPGERNPQGDGQPPQAGQVPKSRSGASAADVAAAKNDAKPPAQPPKSGQQGGGSQEASPGSGRSSSKDALKHTRGVGALLLAVPMEDRLIGAVNPGAVRSTTRTANASGTPAATATAAQERGQQNGTNGRIGHPAASLHDERLVRAYFRRGGVPTATTTTR